MIKIKNKEVVSMYLGGWKILSVYTRGQKVWPAGNNLIIDETLSCYYNGYWIDEYPWTDDTSWTD